MNHTEVIQHFIDTIGAKSYLEIGLGDLTNFNAIQCELKHGVDPDDTKELPESTENVIVFRLSSDAFFDRSDAAPVKYDVIFIDGLHHADQAQRDIENALSCLTPGGVIIVHDINPSNEEMTIVPRKTKQWTGDIYKYWYIFNHRARGVTISNLADDFGIGVIQLIGDFKMTKQPVKIPTFQQYKEWIAEQFTQL